MKAAEIKRYFDLVSNHEVKEICEPLFNNFEINLFSYNKIYPDGSRILLSSNEEFILWIFDTKCSMANSFQMHIKEGIYSLNQIEVVLPPADRRKFIFQNSGAHNYFNLDYNEKACNIIEKTDDGAYEIYDFVSPVYSSISSDFYTNNTEILKHFIMHFKVKAKRIIAIAEKNRICTGIKKVKAISVQNAQFEPMNAKSNFYAMTELKRFPIPNNEKMYLTQREIECLMHLFKGRVAKETAAILNISVKSVESYLETTREKLGCIKRSDLIAKAIEIHSTDPGYFDWLTRI